MTGGRRGRWLELAVRVLGRPLEVRGGEGARGDAVVVLGAPLRADGSLTVVVEERVRAGVELWRRGAAPVICVTGGRNPDAKAETTEAEAMARRARELGVPKAALCVEGQSRNTSENARRSAELLLPAGRRRVIVVTQPFHSRRAVLWFRRAGFDAVGWHIADSVQFRDARRGLKWVLREYGSLARDLVVTRKPSG